MKKILLLLCLFKNICFGQTRIEGTLTSLPNTSFSVKTDQSALNDYSGILIAQGTTNGEGQISLAIDLKAEQPITLFIDRIFFILWVKPNTSLTIQQKPNGRYVFSGVTANENTFLFKTGLMQPNIVPKNIGMNNFEPEKQLTYLDSIETKRQSVLADLSKDENISKKFISYCHAEISGFTSFNKNQYPALFKLTNKITDKDIPHDYFNFWNRFRLEQDSTASNSYDNALRDFIEYKTLERIGKSQTGKENYWKENFKTIDTLLSEHPISLQKQKASALLLLIKYFNFTDVTALEIENYKKQFPSSASSSLIDNLWQKKNGSTSTTPAFRLKNKEGNWVDIKDLRGKVVYIDFWGSWCNACIINMPHSKLLRQKFKDKDVAFLFLDFYDTNEKWRNAIKKYDIDGIHLKAEKADEAYFNINFGVSQGFPRYALIDKNGKLVTISAPPPQDQSAYELIKKYVNK